MERRTFEAPMEWEYQNAGPVDLTSPFAQVAKKRSDNLFNAPLKPSTAQSNSFSAFGTPSKPPTRSFFTPQLAPRVVAPPFRNPAFTTPRKLDDAGLSDSSFAETSFTEGEASFTTALEGSPSRTEASAVLDDTPESGHVSDATVANSPTPTKVDKNSRYNRGSPRRHAAGRGEIRPAREVPRKELQVLRKRKRHNFDKDVSSVMRHLPRDWEGEASDSDTSMVSYQGASPSRIAAPPSSSQHKNQRPATPPTREGWFVSVLGTMDRYPGAPDHIYRWLQLGLNCFMIGIVIFFGWAVVEAVRSDIRNANEMARMEIMSRISECQNHYTSNECSKRDRPALRALCDEWYDCMTQDSDAIMRVKVTIKQVAEVINEFADAMNFKAWVMFGTIAVFIIFSNVMLQWGRSKSQATPLHASAFSHVPMMGPDTTPAHFRARFETPRSQRYAYLEDDMADADMSPSRMAMGSGFTYTSTGRRSPGRGERPLSPIRYHQSPGRGVERSGGALRWQ
ncbi:Di-sulfide bridge nucleocytoplasmic transport domain-containing protein [Trichoderma novae-zelandiae]